MSKIIGGAQQPTEQQQMAELARLIRGAEDVKCDACGASNFINIYKIRKISGLMTGTGKDMIIPVPVYACADCGHVNEKFLKSVGLDRDEPVTKDSPEAKESGLNSNIFDQNNEPSAPNTNIEPPKFQSVVEGGA